MPAGHSVTNNPHTLSKIHCLPEKTCTQPLFEILSSHSISHQLFADDTQLQDSGNIDQFDHTKNCLQPYSCNVKNWMLENKLQLNQEKTAMIVGLPKLLPDYKHLFHGCM